MKWPVRVSYPVAAVKLNLVVMCCAFVIFGVSLLFQPHRWASTPAYHVLLEIFAAQAWGGLFLASGVLLGVSARMYGRTRWLIVSALMLALALTCGWMLAFVVRYLTSPDTTPETWVSWFVFAYLLIVIAVGLDQPPGDTERERELPEITAYRQAVDDALAGAAADRKASVAAALNAAGDREAAVAAALDAEAARLRERVAAACDAYAAALAAVVPAGAMPSGDIAAHAISEARNALLRAEEAYERATGRPAGPGPP